jgi:uncharacterized protein YndB with AHSA1/START domain
MKLDLHFRELYPHPIEAVWAAISDSTALAVWLMPNDFEPRVGKRFTFRRNPTLEWRDSIECEVLAIEPPARIVWSWKSSEGSSPGRVEIRLRSVEGGTELILDHIGEPDSRRRAGYEAGWPGKFAVLRDQLSLAQQDH